MSSEQYSETPLADAKRCPQCGEMMPSSAAGCARCAAKHAIQEGVPARYQGSGDLPDFRARPTGDGLAFAVFGVVVLLLGFGLVFIAPGVFLVLLALAMPAVIRATIFSLRKRDETAVSRQPSFVRTLFSSLGVAALAWTAGTLFFIPTFVVALTVACASGMHKGVEGSICIFAIPTIVGLAVAVSHFWLYWSRKG